MEELIKLIREVPLNEIEQELHIHFSKLKSEKDQLKTIMALSLLARQSLEVIKEMNVDDIISPLKKRIEETTKEYHSYMETLQMRLTENDILSGLLLKGQPEEEYQIIRKKIDQLMLLQEQLLEHAITKREQTRFETIASEK